MNKPYGSICAGLIAAITLFGCATEKSKPFSFLIDDSTPLEQGQTINMEVGESFRVVSYSGDDRAQGCEWSSSDETVALVTPYGSLTALHGGESKITMSHEDTTFSFTVRIPVVEHADLYYYFKGSAFDEEGRMGYIRDYFYIDGVLQDEKCNILESDELGNIYQGYWADGKLSFKLNGVEVAKDKPLQGLVTRTFAKKGKVYLLTNESYLSPGVIAQCHILSEDGSWRDIDFDLSSYGSPAGSISFVDEDSEGNILIWGGLTQGDHLYAPLFSNVWQIDIAGNIRSGSCYYHDEAKDWDMPPISDVALDIDDNVYYLGEKQVWKGGKIDEEFFNPGWHPGEYLYTLGKTPSTPNGISPSGVNGMRSKLIVQGHDVYYAVCEVDQRGEKYAVNIYKNGELHLVAARSRGEQVFGGIIDCYITPSGDIYTIHTDIGAIYITKNGQLIRYQPCDNANDPSFAVRER